MQVYRDTQKLASASTDGYSSLIRINVCKCKLTILLTIVTHKSEDSIKADLKEIGPVGGLL